MGRKSKETSVEERKIIFRMREDGKTVKDIASSVNRSIYTVYSILKRKKVISEPRSGRPEKLTFRDKNILLRKVKLQPKMSAPEMNRELAEYRGVHVSDETVRRVLRSAGYNGRTARRKPYISAVNRKKRIEFAKKHMNCTDEFWSSVIFSDETKFNIFGPDGGNKVWRKPNTELDPKITLPTVKRCWQYSIY